MPRRPILAVGGLLLISPILLAPRPLAAQSGSLFGGRGPTSQATLGGSRSGTMGSSGFRMGSTLGATGAGTFGSGVTGFGGSALGGSALGMTGQGTMGRSTTGTGFVGRNFSSQGFVGSQQAGQTGALGRTGGFGQFGGLGQTGFGQNQFGFGGFQRNNRNRDNDNFGFQNQGRNAQSNQQPQIVIRSQVAFPVPERAPAAVVNRLDTRFERIAERGPQFADVSFQLAPTGDVVLRGTVPTEHARDLAAALARLEPGVRAVRNELVVADEPAAR